MRKILRAVLVLSVVAAMALSLASCDMLPEDLRSMLDGLIGGGECQHTDVEWVIDTEATCKIEGTKHSECADCGEILEYANVEKSTEHTLGEWVVDIEPSCTRVGSRYKRCTVCKAKIITEEIPLLDTHNYDYGACLECKSIQPPSVGLDIVSNGDGTASVKGIGTCADTSVVIPSVSPAGEAVTKILASAFLDQTQIVSIIIPDSITVADSTAFKNCTISKATANAKVISTLKTNHLKYLTVTGTGAIPTTAFNAAGGLTTLKISEGITAIGSSAFNGCGSLRAISFPESLVNIGEAAFANCPALKVLNIGNNVTTIGERAFHNCDFLDQVYIPASVTKIGLKAFYQSPRITKAVFEITEGWTLNGAPINPADLIDTGKNGAVGVLWSAETGELVRS